MITPLHPAACLIAALAAAAVVRPTVAAPGDRSTPAPLMTVSSTQRAPTIDGKIEQDEWRAAAQTTGFINLADGMAAEPQTVVCVSFDDRKLYLAFECPLTSERSPTASESGRDGRVWSDDSFELLLLPQGRKPTQFYHFIGNSIGAFYDTYERNRKWNGQWEYKAASGMGWWRGELSIPLADLGVKSLGGQTWRANFCRNVGKHTAWADTGRGYINPAKFGTVRFVDRGVVLRIKSIEGFRTGQVRVSGRVLNRSPNQTVSPMSARATAPSHSAPEVWPVDGHRLWRPLRIFNLTSGGHKEFVVPAIVRGKDLKHLHIGMRSRDGEQLHRQTIPFTPTGLRYVSLLAEPSEQKLYARIDLRGVTEARAADVQLTFAHTDANRGSQWHIRGLATGRMHVHEGGVVGWPEGSYKVSARILAAPGGKLLHGETLQYERVLAPKWYTEGTKIGTAHRVLKPWTPVVWDEAKVKVWGREHDFAGQLLPAQITSAGAALLSKPISLRGTCDGQSADATLDQRATGETAPDSVTTAATGRLGRLPVRVEAHAEYDGLVKFTLDLLPKAEVKLDKLDLLIPLRSERALYYHITTTYYGRGVSGTVPNKGVRDRFRPFVWLGDDERGLMWFAESPAGWHSDEYPIHIEPSADSTELRIELVNRPMTLDKPRRIVFGLQATPVKPLPPDWRAWRVDSLYTTARRVQKHFIDWRSLGVELKWRHLWWTAGHKRIFMPGHMTPLQVMPDLERYVKQAHGLGDRLLTYFYLHGVNRITTSYDRYYPAWQTAQPKEMSYWGRVIMGACPGSTMGDMLLYGIRDMVRRYGIDGVYFDGAGPPIGCDNALHGHGWIGDDGRRRYCYPIFGLRRFYKRLATMLDEELERPVIWVHADGKMPTPCFSFCTANWEGEMVQGQLKREGAVLSDLLGLDFCRSHLVATPWGVPSLWLPSRYGSAGNKARQARDCMALMLVHGTPVSRVPSFDRELIKSVWLAQAKFGIREAAFHGYWQETSRLVISPRHARVVASYYERDGKRLVAVGNFTDEARKMKLSFRDVRARSARDAISGAVVGVQAGVLSLETDARSFRLIEVTAR